MPGHVSTLPAISRKPTRPNRKSSFINGNHGIQTHGLIDTLRWAIGDESKECITAFHRNGPIWMVHAEREVQAFRLGAIRMESLEVASVAALFGGRADYLGMIEKWGKGAFTRPPSITIVINCQYLFTLHSSTQCMYVICTDDTSIELVAYVNGY